MQEASESLAPSTRVIYAVFDRLRGRGTAILVSLVALTVAAVLASGIYVVKKEEQAVLTRFGEVVRTEISPGIHYALPLVERAHIRKVMRITRQDVATRDEQGSVSFSILSGDANLFEANIALQYRIGNLRNYLYATADPEAVLTLIVRERLIQIMGRNFIDLIFTNNRDIIQAHLFRNITAWLEVNDIGIELLALSIVDLRPIDETVAAFRDVSDAIAESIQSVSDARRRTERLLARSRGQAKALVTNAQARAQERRQQAESTADAFSHLLATYHSQPAPVMVTRYWQRMRTIFQNATLAAAGPGDTSAIDINMVDGFMPGVGWAPGAPVPADVSKESLTGARRSFTTVSEWGRHGFENVEQDRFSISGRFHSTASERHHLGTARPRSLIFDDLSIFSHRHVVPTPVAAAAERDEPPLVTRTVVEPNEGDENRQAPGGEAMPERADPEQATSLKAETAAGAKPESTAEAETSDAPSR